MKRPGGPAHRRTGAPAQRLGGAPSGWFGPAAAARVCICAVLAASGLSSPVSAQTWRTITSARQLHGERELTVSVQYGAGRFRLGPGEERQLYRLEMRYDEDRFAPLREYDATNGTLRLGMRGRNGARLSLGGRRGSSTPQYFDLSLSPEVPLSLSLDLGAVESNVELGGLALRRVSYRTGASETHLSFSRANPIECEELRLDAGAAAFDARALANSNCARLSFHGGVGDVMLDFTGSWRRAMEAHLDVGIGKLDLRLPRDVGVSLHVNRFLASFDAGGLERRGDVYYTANWATARQRLELHVNAAIGSIRVSWAEP